ncbi:MAG: hypothetical protein AB1483_06610 [Candidatus Zixiibacteriota bacterium]
MRLSVSVKLAVVFALVVSLVWSGCSKKSPKRDQIPLLKGKIFALQEAVKERNRAAIDSLLSVKIIDNGQSSDSLLSFVYGPDGGFGFERFGNCEILYTANKARMECYVMDSTSQEDRPVTFFMALEDDMWLFTSFQQGGGEKDSL